MPHIASYNPSLRVAGTNEAIHLGFDDWYDESEILQKLGRIYGVRTVAELLDKIRGGRVAKQSVRDGLLKVELGSPNNKCIVVDKNQSLA